jgi:hypothetical protein
MYLVISDRVDVYMLVLYNFLVVVVVMETHSQGLYLLPLLDLYLKKLKIQSINQFFNIFNQLNHE